ncbi:MAG TPA: substrate-binding domain-containing protein [Spirochaetia bacterium]|nr:substrate-binding domain-containing protein [Spirochaetia bacterium]
MNAKRLLAACCSAAIVLFAAQSVFAADQSSPIKIGLVVKTLTNPYFVTMIGAAKKYAAEKGITLITGSGAYDGDNAGQITAMENMASAGVKGILFTPSDSSAIVPTVEKLRKQGIVMIALDTSTTPESATDGFFATDNFQAGKLIGEYAKAAMAGKTPVIAMLDGTLGSTVSQQRHDGFLAGFGIKEGAPSIVSEQATNGDESKALTAMENSLSKNPQINLVYSINEPAGFGAYTAIKKAGKIKDIMIVSIDGSHNGVEAVKSKEFAADSMQFPAKMAQDGIDAVITYAQSGVKPTGYVNTGCALISDTPEHGLSIESSSWGLHNAWGGKG